jgi:hypothetical protein
MPIIDPIASIRILKKANCSTLSGKSKLTYHIGCNAESEIHLRIHANDGGGYFSQEWVAWKGIQKALEKATPITSIVLYSLFRGKSVNTPAFLLAVLKHEGLLRPLKGKKRSHEMIDPKVFIAKVKKLMVSSAAPKAADTTKKSVRKTPIKKKVPTSSRK